MGGNELVRDFPIVAGARKLLCVSAKKVPGVSGVGALALCLPYQHIKHTTIVLPKVVGRYYYYAIKAMYYICRLAVAAAVPLIAMPRPQLHFTSSSSFFLLNGPDFAPS